MGGPGGATTKAAAVSLIPTGFLAPPSFPCPRVTCAGTQSLDIESVQAQPLVSLKPGLPLLQWAPCPTPCCVWYWQDGSSSATLSTPLRENSVLAEQVAEMQCEASVRGN